MTRLELPAISARSLHVSERALSRRLGYPEGRIPDGRPQTLVARARRAFEQAASPWSRGVEIEVSRRTDGGIQVENGIVLRSALLARRTKLAAADRAVIVGLTLGSRLDLAIHRLWETDEVDVAYFLEAYAVAALGAALTNLSLAIGERMRPHGLMVLPHYCPGFEGWAIDDQSQLFGLLGLDHEAENATPIRLLETAALEPQKSMLALYLLTGIQSVFQQAASWNPCASCSIHNCACLKARSA